MHISPVDEQNETLSTWVEEMTHTHAIFRKDNLDELIIDIEEPYSSARKSVTRFHALHVYFRINPSKAKL